MSKPRIIAGRLPDTTRELVYGLAELSTADLEKVRQVCRRHAQAEATDELRMLEQEALHLAGTTQVGRLATAYEALTGDKP